MTVKKVNFYIGRTRKYVPALVTNPAYPEINVRQKSETGELKAAGNDGWPSDCVRRQKSKASRVSGEISHRAMLCL